VGIGTATPAYPLSVAGRISYSSGIGEGADLTVSSSSTTLQFGLGSSWVAQSFYISGTTAMTLNSTGLGVGVSPSVKLDINGDIKIRDTFSLFMGFGNEQKIFVGGGANSTYLTFNQWTGAAYTERLRIDSSGNVGVAVAPSAWNTTYAALQVGLSGSLSSYKATYYDAFASSCNYFENTSGQDRYVNNGYASQHFQYLGSHIFRTAGNNTSGANQPLTWTQAMTLDASGNLLVGKNSSASTVIGGEIRSTGIGIFNVSADQALICNRSTSVGDLVVFRYSNAQVGSVSVTALATTYNTSSDYRLKESVKPLNGGLARVNALKPSVYNWKSDGSTGEGFLAHELAEVVPAAVTGEKDAVNADGTIKSQGIDMSRIVPILVAAIQELTAEVNALKNA
jgi:hypothetical protein